MSAPNPVEKRSFPLEGSNLYRLIMDPEFRRVFHGRVQQGNRLMAPMYKIGLLPLFGMSKQIMLLTTRGRKTGKLRDTPIGYFRIDGVIHVFTGWGKGANWVKNIQAHPEEVWFQIGLKRTHARAEVVDDPQQVIRLAECLAQQNPARAKILMGWDPEVDRVESADFTLMGEKVIVVRFLPA